MDVALANVAGFNNIEDAVISVSLRAGSLKLISLSTPQMAKVALEFKD